MARPPETGNKAKKELEESSFPLEKIVGDPTQMVLQGGELGKALLGKSMKVGGYLTKGVHAFGTVKNERMLPDNESGLERYVATKFAAQIPEGAVAVCNYNVQIAVGSSGGSFSDFIFIYHAQGTALIPKDRKE